MYGLNWSRPDMLLIVAQLQEAKQARATERAVKAWQSRRLFQVVEGGGRLDVAT